MIVTIALILLGFVDLVLAISAGLGFALLQDIMKYILELQIQVRRLEDATGTK